MPRYTKTAALELIYFAKSMYIRAHYFDPKATSAFEFARQMSSPNLKKANPAFEFNFLNDHENEAPATLTAEFIDGSKWDIKTGDLHTSDLRNQFFQMCEDIEDEYDKAGKPTPGGAGAGGPGDAGAAKKGKK